ncbi:protein disulfide isomerase [Phlegmacium glaucopus]|nr:protein disulfide isomerase [Phlegmacium glaucopus]
MRFFVALKELPFSMLVTLIALAVSALPVNTLDLTPETFGPTVKNGLWFVEHYSPHCHHCRSFKPTWDQLVVESKKEIPTVALATINCALYGDLCSLNGVSGWPTMLMFDQGKVVGQFEGSRELDDLKKFMKQYVKEETKQLSASSTVSTIQTSTTPPTSPPIKQPPPPPVNPTGEVLVLDRDLLRDTLLKGPAFVKFFAPWCGHCKKLAPVWKLLARHMQNRLTIAEVNCDDHSSFCKSQNIEGYPTLFYFDNNGVKSEYTGGRRIPQLMAFAEKAASAGVLTLDKPEELETIAAKEDVVYLLLHTPENSGILKFVGEASAPLLGSPSIYASSSPELRSQYSIPTTSHWSISVLKDHDTALPSATFYGSPEVTQDKLRAWLLTHRLPTTLELTQDTFQSVMNAPQSPLVVIAASHKDKSDKIRDRFRDLGRKWRVRTEGSGIVHGREVVFTWMNMDAWGKWMKSMYGIQPNDNDDHHQDMDLEDVKVIIADHSKLVYYETDRSGLPITMSAADKLFSAVDDVATGKSPYKHSENYIERVARFLSSKLTSIETFVFDKPFQALFILVAAVAVIFWVLHRLIGNDASSTSFKEYKGKNGRLD